MYGPGGQQSGGVTPGEPQIQGGQSQATPPQNVSPAEQPRPPSTGYGDWARNQRPQGTVYGGPGSGSASNNGPLPTGPGVGQQESTGSLTGHILSQGAEDVQPKSRNVKVIVIIIVILLVLVGGGLAAAFFFQGFIDDNLHLSGS
jgi:hypothetical protein